MAIVVGQVVATVIAGVAGTLALRRFPRGEARRSGTTGGDRLLRRPVECRHRRHLARAALTPVLLGVVAGTTQVGYFRVALARRAVSAASAPVRLMLLTEQTRDWERGREDTVLRGVRAIHDRGGGVAVVAVPVFLVAMPLLVRVVFGERVRARGRRGADRPRLGGDPARARLVEVVAGDDRPATPADRDPRGRGARAAPARGRARRPMGGHRCGGRDARLDAAFRRRRGPSCWCACAPSSRAGGTSVRRRAPAREGRRRVGHLAARRRRAPRATRRRWRERSRAPGTRWRSSRPRMRSLRRPPTRCVGAPLAGRAAAPSRGRADAPVPLAAPTACTRRP